MMPLILLIPLAIIIGGGIGFAIGFFTPKLFSKISNKILEKRALKMIEGKIENKYELDGKKQDVDIFIVKDKKDKEIIVNLTK